MESSDSASDALLRLDRLPATRRFLQKLWARKDWEAKNPELAATWNDALAEDDARTRAAELGQSQQEASRRGKVTLRRLGVPVLPAKAAHAPKATPALSAAKQWALAGKQTLLLLGGVGSGKTCAAAWLLLRHLKREATTPRPSGGVALDAAMFAGAPEFNGLSDYNPEARAWLDRLCRCGLLVLDDLGTERMGDGELSCIQRVLTERHGAGRQTVLTANMSAEAFRRRYGDRVADRLAEAGMVVGSGDKSLRQAAPVAGEDTLKPPLRTAPTQHPGRSPS